MKYKKGFTLIEISLFLALSGLLIVGVIAGTNRSISHQRYNNSVDSFVDSLKGLYSQVTYTQNSVATEAGRHGKAIYGKLITFGEDDSDLSKVHIYTVIGKVLSSRDISDLGNISPLESLYWADADVFLTENFETSIVNESSFNLDWGAVLENGDNTPLKKTLLIVRSPLSGDIFTYVSDEALPVHEGTEGFLKNYLPIFTNRPEEDYEANLNQDLLSRVFKTEDLNFCIDSGDRWAAGNFRRNVRIFAGGHNSTAVEVILDNAEGNPCVE